jgi:hypothetical protein
MAGVMSVFFPLVGMLVVMMGPLAMMAVSVILEVTKYAGVRIDTKKACPHDVGRQGSKFGTYPSPLAVPSPSSLIAKMRIPANPIPMMNVMVVVMAISAVGASMRGRHYRIFIRRRENCVRDVGVYFLRWMHITGRRSGVGWRQNSKLNSLACPLPLSVNSALGLCIILKICFTPASHFYTTQNCACFFAHYVVFSTLVVVLIRAKASHF